MIASLVAVRRATRPCARARASRRACPSSCCAAASDARRTRAAASGRAATADRAGRRRGRPLPSRCRASIASAIATCSGSPPCDAQASASWSSPQCSSSKPPDSRSGITWNGFAHERHELTICGRARRRRACRRRRRPPRARDGAIRSSAPRVATTSSSSVFMRGACPRLARADNVTAQASGRWS